MSKKATRQKFTKELEEDAIKLVLEQGLQQFRDWATSWHAFI